MAQKSTPKMTQTLIKTAIVNALMTLLLAVAGHSVAVAQEPAALTIAAPQPAVGEVSLVLGKAWLVSGSGRRAVATGTEIRAEDRILTEANGHVHIRFVDQALVSVRPDSRLEIVQYDYNADAPEQSTIKLNLEEGITRAISGAGASAARERFRLNTPIAAIGVRGTDFVVSATPRAVRALVNEGVIVMAPFSSDCRADSFGPCLINAVELTGSSLQVIELEGSSTAPRLLPAAVERGPGMMEEEVRVAVNDVQNNADDQNAGTGIYLESVTSQRVKNEAANATQPQQPPQQPTPETPTPSLVDFTPETAIAGAELAERNLIWGRWGDGQAAQERMTVAMAEASAGRDVTVPGGADYLLFRAGNGGERIASGLGTVSFGLASAQAFYHSDSGVAAMTVNGGSLDINFDNSRFSTGLDLNHSLTGDVQFSASGRLYDGGYFHTRSDTERMAGAVSLDGTEAGYFFEKQLESGNIQGLTLWDAP
ncbi:FecR family protein [Pseudohongiella sp.]|uniref:FecR protein domain-containing protein n=1 Tax=marine sediment metagenome TaxID=412755 RepID=A0A0F9VXJ1_9ZZZZ|nr:FecR family protein [Pseudohongiella sp.]